MVSWEGGIHTILSKQMTPYHPVMRYYSLLSQPYATSQDALIYTISWAVFLFRGWLHFFHKLTFLHYFDDSISKLHISNREIFSLVTPILTSDVHQNLLSVELNNMRVIYIMHVLFKYNVTNYILNCSRG